jgi:hypothetical protein
LNPEKQLTKFGVVPLNRIPHNNCTSITPDQLNLRDGLSVTLANQMIEYILNREDVRKLVMMQQNMPGKESEHHKQQSTHTNK